MDMENKEGGLSYTLGWVALVSVFGHILCCGLPLVLGVVSLMTGFGVFSVSFPLLDTIRGALEGTEGPMMGFSAMVLAVGWGTQIYAARIDCHDTGCVHAPCGGRKRKTTRLLWLATVIFAVNLLSFTVEHSHRELHDHHGHRFPAMEQAGIQG